MEPVTPTRLFDSIDTIEIRHLSKRYGDVRAVEDLNLDIAGGELLILIGGSGSGKTTTLRMINRLITPDTGTITINGQDVSGLDPVRLRRNIGYVIQQIGLFPHMTVRENIGLVPRIEGWSRDAITDRVRELLALVDLPPDSYIDRYPRELSGGQQQRIGLARAMVMDPPLLLMDEPFGALDPILRKQLQDEFLEIKKAIGRTIIFVTHDINEAVKLGDRIAIMHDGRLIQTGTPEDLILNPEDAIVSNLVEADRKFRYIETLEVQNLMSTVPKRSLYDAETGAGQALESMIAQDVGCAIVMEDGRLRGTVTVRDLFPVRHDRVVLGDLAETPPLFSMNDSVLSALEKMKATGASFALVIDGDDLRGVFIPDDVMLRLI